MNVTDEQALSDIAGVLYVDVADLEHDVDLRDQGMDSVRIMALVQQWRQAGLPEVDFIALAEDQRIEHWLTVLQKMQSQ